MFGFHRIAAAVPAIAVGAVNGNAAAVRALYERAAEAGASVVLFPELTLTGASAGDLWFQEAVLTAVRSAALNLAAGTAEHSAILAVGLPLADGERLYDAVMFAQEGRILGFVPKNTLTAAERRWFAPGPEAGEILFDGELYPFGSALRLTDEAGLVCEVAWGEPAQNCAPVVLVPAAERAAAGRTAEIREELAADSRRRIAAVVRAGAGAGESTTDGVYDGLAMIAVTGKIAAESAFPAGSDTLTFADVDCERLTALRRKRGGAAEPADDAFYVGTVTPPAGSPDWQYAQSALDPAPLAPADPAYAEECFAIQTAGLVKRILHTRAKKLVLGFSGGLDSTLALLVAEAALRQLGRGPEDLLVLTMPGFGTTEGTLHNVKALMKALKIKLVTVPIADAVNLHFRDLGHDPAVHDAVYENSQARERTQILMDAANGCGGIVVGTGDLSEAALGWCTFNGDHVSMYAVNGNVGKTLIRRIVGAEAARRGGAAGKALQAVLDTPVSPELLPPGKDGDTEQKTEEILGSYDLHDFFLAHFLGYGAAPEKLQALAEAAFAGKFTPEEIRHALQIFVKRFLSQQFKRNCSPDGPAIGAPSLSPRNGLVLPSDLAAAEEWEC